MLNSRIHAFRCAAITGVAGLALIPAVAFAQESGAGQPDQATSEDIVVTGTLIRGAAPVGSNAITVGEERIQEVAAASSNELLASIPQVTNFFNNVPVSQLGIAVNQIQINRPNIRNISPNNAIGSATLVLVDGHRIAPAGTTQASVDPDVIPTGAIERVDVVTEGGSSIYGADAVAGVINFVTLKRFNGVKVDGHYGFADDYYQWDASATVGKAWDTGSVYASYTYAKTDRLRGRERDFIRDVDYTSFPYKERNRICDQSNLSLNTIVNAGGGVLVNFGSVTYAAPNYVPGTLNTCKAYTDYLPEVERHGAIVGLTQELGDKTSIEAKGFFSKRTTVTRSPYGGTVTVGPGNPYNASNLPPGLNVGPTFINIPGIPFPIPATNQAAVDFSLRSVYGDDGASANTSIKEYGANVEVKHELTDRWQLRGLLNWSKSETQYTIAGLSPTRLAAAGVATTTATAINPYNPAQTNRALLDDLIDAESGGLAKDTLFDARLIADGKLFTIGGGDISLAVGYEYMHDSIDQGFATDVRRGEVSNAPLIGYGRDVHSVFGELQVPLIGEGNRSNGLYSFVLSASGRYDHYSDFGDTFNPKFAAVFKPFEWLGFRGNWGTSFTAPTTLDQLGAFRNTIGAFPFVAFPKPGETAPNGAATMALQGSQSGLKPQTATTWSVGMDLDPMQGLHASVNYYDVNFEDILANPFSADIFNDFPNAIRTNPAGFSPAELRAFGALAPGGSAVAEQLISSGTLVYELVDFRVGNFGRVHVKGIDFAFNYRHDTSIGGFDVAVSGNAPLDRKSQTSPTSAIVDNLLTENPKLYLQSTVGFDFGGFRAQAMWNFTGGYDINPTTSVPVQDSVDSFSTVDLFFKYDVPSESKLLSNLSFTLNVKNVFDQEPPILRRNLNGEAGFANGFSLGRMIILGARKQF